MKLDGHKHLIAWAGTALLVCSNESNAEQMNESPFIEYALSPNLSSDETYTVELLIDHVRSTFDKNYWDGWMARSDAREKPGYKPSFSREHVRPAANELSKITWISLQRLRTAAPPVRNISALRYLPALTGLSLGQNEIADLTPLQHCKSLRRLHLTENKIQSLSSLAGCVALEELEIRGNPITDMAALESLPKLKTLEISTDQIPVFKKVSRLPALTEIELGNQMFESFQGLPAMPKLRIISGATVRSLAGIENYPNLESLINFSGEFDSLDPLRGMKGLTHANLNGCRVSDLYPLSSQLALRELWIDTEVPMLDLSPLDSLPDLHEVTVKCNGIEPESLHRLRQELTSWDVEFYSSEARHTPSLEIEVVDQKTFDIYDTKKQYGIKDSDSNKSLLRSELEWLDEKIEEVFEVDFKEGEPSSFSWTAKVG